VLYSGDALKNHAFLGDSLSEDPNRPQYDLTSKPKIVKVTSLV
jgi:hypothetical protein